MAWNHKGFEIELQGSRFVTRIDGKITGGDSLKALIKTINKHIDLKAQAGEIKLPVVLLVGPGRYDDGEEIVIKRVITGLDTDKLSVLGLDIPAKMSLEAMLPDCPGNEELLRQFAETRAALKSLDVAVDARRVSERHMGGFGRSQRSYADAVRYLREEYVTAMKAKVK